jgi:hypothetical protein
MKEKIDFHGQSYQKTKFWMSKVLIMGLIALTLGSCSSDLRKIEGELSDVESEILTRWDNQREINKEWNIYINHMWKWDNPEIYEMEQWTYERAQDNREEYDELIEERNRLLKKRDEAIAKSKWNRHRSQYDEHEFENSDNAIRDAIKNRQN